jgi:hypothetical protein
MVKDKEAFMRLRTLLVSVAAAAILVGATVIALHGEPSVFTSSNYYVFGLAGTSIDLAALDQAVQSAGYTVIRYDGNTIVAHVAGDPSTASVAELLAGERVLVVDGSRFLLRVRDDAYTYTLRPAVSGLELVFSPHADQGMDAVVDVLLSLQALGVIGSEVDFNFQSYAKDSLKGPAPPDGVGIDSDLYWLTIAEDWHAFAAAKGITLVGLRVEVVAEVSPDALIPSDYFGYVTSESGSLVGLLLPIDLVVSLASSDSVVLLRQAYQPTAP